MSAYLANILTSENFEDKKFYNVVSDEGDLIEGIPTLIIGREKAKELYPNAPILDWKINDEVYWTYGKRVRRERNEDDIKKFKKLMLERLIKGADYWFFNVLTATKEEKTKFNITLMDSTRKVVLISGDMAYIYYVDTHETIGVSLYDIDYSGVGRDKILKLFERNKSIKIINERDFISYETRDIVINKKYIIPYLSTLVPSN